MPSHVFILYLTIFKEKEAMNLKENWDFFKKKKICATDPFWIEWTKSMWADMVVLLYHYSLIISWAVRSVWS